jgi:hypothetical protein
MFNMKPTHLEYVYLRDGYIFDVIRSVRSRTDNKLGWFKAYQRTSAIADRGKRKYEESHLSLPGFVCHCIMCGMQCY